MNIQRYRHFLAVAEGASFARAAERLGMKQPPLSQSIRRLEHDLGVALLERTTQNVRITKAGEAFLPDARAAVAAADRAVARARAAGRAAAPLRVGFVSVALFDVLPKLLRAANDAQIPIQILYSSTNDQLAGLANGSLDLGFVTPPFDAPPRLQITSIGNEPIVAALPTGSVNATKKAIPLEALYDRLIMFPRNDGPFLYDSILSMFRARGLSPQIIDEIPASMLATLALVAAGAGFSFVPAAISRNLSIAGVSFRAAKDRSCSDMAARAGAYADIREQQRSAHGAAHCELDNELALSKPGREKPNIIAARPTHQGQHQGWHEFHDGSGRLAAITAS